MVRDIKKVHEGHLKLLYIYSLLNNRAPEGFPEKPRTTPDQRMYVEKPRTTTPDQPRTTSWTPDQPRTSFMDIVELCAEGFPHNNRTNPGPP